MLDVPRQYPAVSVEQVLGIACVPIGLFSLVIGFGFFGFGFFGFGFFGFGFFGFGFFSAHETV
jgi:hypothetical protein